MPNSSAANMTGRIAYYPTHPGIAMSQIVMLLIRDGLQMPSGTVRDATYSNLLYCKVPNDWIQVHLPSSDDLWLKGPALTDDKLELVLAQLYGASWRNGNSDGSRYVVRG